MILDERILALVRRTGRRREVLAGVAGIRQAVTFK